MLTNSVKLYHLHLGSNDTILHFGFEECWFFYFSLSLSFCLCFFLRVNKYCIVSKVNLMAEFVTKYVYTLDSAHSLALSGARSIKDKMAEFMLYKCTSKSLRITMHVFVSQSYLTQIVFFLSVLNNLWILS